MFSIFHRLLNTDFRAPNGRVCLCGRKRLRSLPTFSTVSPTPTFVLRIGHFCLASACRLWQTPIFVLQKFRGIASYGATTELYFGVPGSFCAKNYDVGLN
jgi:hypothetical protein